MHIRISMCVVLLLIKYLNCTLSSSSFQTSLNDIIVIVFVVMVLELKRYLNKYSNLRQAGKQKMSTNKGDKRIKSYLRDQVNETNS